MPKLSTRAAGPRIARQSAWVRIFLFLGLLLLGWGPLALVIYWLGERLALTDTASAAALILLYALFISLLRRWGRAVHRWGHPLSHCGLRWSSRLWSGLLKALLAGVLAVFGLFGLEVLLGWAIPQPPSWSLLWTALEGLLVALGIGLAEELFFRGWLLAELERDYPSSVALTINALIFAIAHFLRPLSDILQTLPQFIGLFILGMALVWARRIPSGERWQRTRTDLGLPIGFHAGLVWGYYLIQVGQLTQPKATVPDWLTGIDGNPLAGLLGLILLSIIAAKFARLASASAD
ncbi:MAG: CPBP family intramembrane metalloprotease [Leptolyngbya sp. SIO4C1]|nr:CPBP family intramembrane metalloprotease [Leptolyngbya sp. SIO4C1]